MDVVVLRSAGANGYNQYVYEMNGVDSVQTLVITRARGANSPEVEAVVRNAEVVYFAGGDQCNYVENFKGTAVERAVKSVYARGGGVGGTSAGLAVQAEFVFDACRGTILSEDALEDPYDKRLSFTYDFFEWAHLDRVVTESHFTQRDRMGRAMAFVARQIQDGRAESALAVAVDEKTSLVVDRSGVATRARRRRRVLRPGRPPARGVPAAHAADVFELQDLARGGGAAVQPPQPADARVLPAQRGQRPDHARPLLD